MSGDLVGLVAVTLIFGGGTLFLLSISPVGKAFAARLLGKTTIGIDEAEMKESLEAMRTELEDMQRLRGEVAELAERVDFAERLLAQKTGGRVEPGS